MALKHQLNHAVEDNLGSKAPIGPCGFIYIYPETHFNFKEISLLGDKYAEAGAFSLPLLHGVTVEEAFVPNVKAVYKKIDMTTVSVKLSTFYNRAIIFHNVEKFESIFSGPGLGSLCKEACDLFGYVPFTPLGEGSTDVSDICPPVWQEKDAIMAVVITEGFKERLHLGKLIYLKSQMHSVMINKTEVYRIPLYDEDLFTKKSSLRRLYLPAVSEYLYYTLYTSLAQSLRVHNAASLVEEIQEQFVHDKYKMAKLVSFKEYPLATVGACDTTLMVIDAVAAELGLSYSLSFFEAPQEKTKVQDYYSWDIFASCETDSDRLEALSKWNALQAIHIHAQLFSTNSIYYVNRVARQAPIPNSKVEPNVYNSYYLQHGLANLCEETLFEDGSPAFTGAPASSLDGSSFTLQHLAYAAAFSPNLLARMCYYLQFCQHQKSTLNPAYNITEYVGSAANSPVCSLCSGQCPCVCINTLFYRLKDRFPPVLQGSRRDPYVITGITNVFNELDFLGNFASFRDKDEDQNQTEETPRYTYWQLNQTLTEKLEAAGLVDSPVADEGAGGSGSMNLEKFVRTFSDIDSLVDAEAAKFINTMIKNNVNFKESIKGVSHVIQYNCNTYWQAPCSLMLNLYYRSILTIIQDIALPISTVYESENPAQGYKPNEWLKLHYQTLWTNFKSFFIDKGVITGTEMKVVHAEQFSDFFDVDAATNNMYSPVKVQVRLARAQVLALKNIKVKNRILFSGTSMSEHYQNAFLKTANRRDNYILAGPYVKFLNSFHRQLFPNLKISCLYLWSNFCKKKQIPCVPGVSAEALNKFFSYINNNSKQFEEVNMLDVVPDSYVTYAKQRLNNAILRACGQTQFYAVTIHSIFPKVQETCALEYPHVLGTSSVDSVEDYVNNVQNLKALTVNSSLRESAANLARSRPIVTLPVVVNKYTGIAGNAQLFQSANLGYFMGRGVDKNLLGDSLFVKKQQNSYMRKKYLFMTPLVGNLLKPSYTHQGTAFEIETVKRTIQSILEDQADEDVLNRVVCELVKSLGAGCADLTLDDIQFYLGSYGMFSENILEKLDQLRELVGPWTHEWAESVLKSGTCETDEVQFVAFEEEQVKLTSMDHSGKVVGGKKRKIATMFDDLDL
ncbi:ORF6 [Alcelaphine gammaherpesvirus 1]|nr:ORF6 [Alcelaphine gammaherpesvirus 1]QDY92299.1 single-stranded DNA-binding protein [Alcelaphine gammaherpesvirus 1]